MNDTQITVIGNAVDDPELRFTPAGQPVARFRVASTPRVRDKATGEWKDGEALFLTVNVWRAMAEHACESIQRGTRVVVDGRLRQRSCETREGEKRTVYEIEADEIGVSVKFAAVQGRQGGPVCARTIRRPCAGRPGGHGGQRRIQQRATILDIPHCRANSGKPALTWDNPHDAGMGIKPEGATVPVPAGHHQRRV